MISSAISFLLLTTAVQQNFYFYQLYDDVQKTLVCFTSDPIFSRDCENASEWIEMQQHQRDKQTLYAQFTNNNNASMLFYKLKFLLKNQSVIEIDQWRIEIVKDSDDLIRNCTKKSTTFDLVLPLKCLDDFPIVGRFLIIILLSYLITKFNVILLMLLFAPLIVLLNCAINYCKNLKMHNFAPISNNQI